jgi:hypothetical protein
MTSRERRAFFERLYGMREAYRNLEAEDCIGITPLAEAMAAAEQELERIAIEAEIQASEDPATSTQHPA